MQNISQQQHPILAVHSSLFKVHLQLIKYLWLYLENRGRIQTQAISFTQNERVDSLNWEKPGSFEFETISFIRKQMKEFLHPESLLMEVSRYLWTYFLFNGNGEGVQRAMASSQYHVQERKSEFILGIKNDCDVVTYILQQQTEVLNKNSSLEEDATFNERLSRILRFLKLKTGTRTRNVQHTSYEEDKELEELDRMLR